ncbi:hypothetical protein FHR99_000746 [Litorivivens lipolytica]|uniref:Uncharacterized protein n=1 Tax=Litorivivens lipolytica TaxID=1524264 RepID=A0A7W4W309_9GAMM|nr:hypothetical protein [Litorivivens lipolytica]MBB3046510.1 hypothetical protein [Litorivivens lipolytica]
MTAWGAYLGACLVLIAIGWLWTRVIGNTYARTAIRFVAITLLLLPVVHESSNEILVPALVVVSLGAFVGNTQEAIEAMNILGGACLGAFMLALVAGWFISNRQRGRAYESEQRQAPTLNDSGDAERTPQPE